MFEKIKYLFKNIPILKSLIKVVCWIRNYRSIHRFQKDAYSLYDDISEGLTREKIAYFSLFGTLLGNVREKGLIKHDNDFDFGVIFTSNLEWRQLYTTLLSKGFALSCFYVENNLVSEMVFQKKGVYVDFFNCIPTNNFHRIYFYYRNPNIRYDSTKVSTAYIDTNVSSTLVQCNINDRKFYYPQNFDSILRDIYGPNWKIPIKGVNTVSECGKRIYNDDCINTMQSPKMFADFIAKYD